MADLASTDVTLALQTQAESVARAIRISSREKQSLVKIDFGDGALTYPSGGVPMPTTASSWGFIRQLNRFDLVDPNDASGILWKVDHANKKLRGYVGNTVPLMVVEEAVTLTANTTGTLKYLPAYVIAIEANDGTVLHTIPSGETVPTNHLGINFTTGAVTALAADAFTSLKVTYIPQQPDGPFAASNLVVNEVITAAAAGVATASRAFAVQHVWNDTNGARMVLDPDGEQPSATGIASIDISPTTTVDTHADDDGDTLHVTYLKYAGLRNPEHEFFDSAVRTVTAGVFDMLAVSKSSIVVPGFGTSAPVEVNTTNANEEAAWSGPGDTAAEGIAIYDPRANDIEEAQTDTIDEFKLPFFLLSAGEPRGMRELSSLAEDAPAAQTLYAHGFGW